MPEPTEVWQLSDQDRERTLNVLEHLSEEDFRNLVWGAHYRRGTAMLLTVEFNADDLHNITVLHNQSLARPTEQVYLGPDPTWPSPSEANDLIADAVRRVLDAAWENATGEKMERES